MIDAPVAGYIAEVTTAALAWVVAARRRYHRAIRTGLTAIAVADLARGALAEWWFRGRAAPFTGVARAVFHLDEALYLVGPGALAWMAVQLFRGTGGAHVVGAGLALFVLLVLGYPVPLRGDVLGQAYLGTHIAAAVVTIAAVVGWYRKVPGRWMTASGTVLLLYVVADAVLVIGPFGGNPFEDWSESWLALFALHLSAVLVQVAMLIARRPGVRVTLRS